MDVKLLCRCPKCNCVQPYWLTETNEPQPATCHPEAGCGHTFTVTIMKSGLADKDPTWPQPKEQQS